MGVDNTVGPHHLSNHNKKETTIMSKYVITAKNMRDAADVIEIDARWAQGEFMEVPDDSGFKLDWDSDTPIRDQQFDIQLKCKDAKFCALGAMAFVKGLPADTFDDPKNFSPKASVALEATFGMAVPRRDWERVGDAIVQFNDMTGRTAAEVADKFRQAADLIDA
jgi:hypothetical protein